MRLNRIAFCIIIVISLIFSCAAAFAFSVNNEIKLGKEASVEVEKEWPLSKNELWQKDISAMGARLAAFVNRKQYTYSFRVVDAKDEINAFALPGGYVYFTERLWRILTPDERAAVLAHEIAHCDQRHAIDQMLKSQQRAIWMLPMVFLGAGWGYAAMVGNAAIAMRYSRKDEREADELGIEMISKAGYGAAGSVTAMKKLLHISRAINGYEVSSIFASHPDTIKRVQYLSDKALQLGAKKADLELPIVSDSDCIGNIIKTNSELQALYARTNMSLTYNEKVIIKKLLWNDDLQKLAPTQIATATVLTPGNLPILLVDVSETFSFTDVTEGDGIYMIKGAEATAPAP